MLRVFSFSRVSFSSLTNNSLKSTFLPIFTRSLSSSPLYRNNNLTESLNQEIAYEAKETLATGFIQKFLNASDFKINDVPGSAQVSFTSQFKNETISIHVSTADINDSEESDGEVEEEDEASAPSPMSLNVIINKKDAGAINLELTIEGDAFYIDHVQYAKDASLLLSPSTKSDTSYSGPHFDQLDEKLQDAFLAYLQERGFNPELANFIPDYMGYKEQNEYILWLKNVKDFVKA